MPPGPASSSSLNASSLGAGSTIFIATVATAGDIDLTRSSSGAVLFGPLVTSFEDSTSFFTSRVSNDIGSERRCASAFSLAATVSSPDEEDEPLLPITSNGTCFVAELIGAGGVDGEVVAEGAFGDSCLTGDSLMPLSMLLCVGGCVGDCELLITLLPVGALMEL